MNPDDKNSTRPRHSLKMVTRLLFVAVCVVTMIALFYAEENWRGQRVWEDCKRQLAAKGRSFDWAKYIPPPVPDDQNVFKAPLMDGFVKERLVFGQGLDLLVKGKTPVLAEHFNKAQAALLPERYKGRAAIVAAEVTVVTPDNATAAQGAAAKLRFGDAQARAAAEKLLLGALGPSLNGPKGRLITARDLEKIRPARVAVQWEAALTVADLEELFSTNAVATVGPAASHLRIEPQGSNVFRVVVAPPPGFTAADLLTATASLEPDIELMRQALKRPCTRMDGDYDQPLAGPVPNFILVRTVALTLTERAQSHLLLGDPDAAWRDLALVHDLCRVLESRPTGKPISLVSVMIDVAVHGLYAYTVADGLRLEAWREPQLSRIEAQLKEVDVLRPLWTAFDTELVFQVAAMESTGPGQLADRVTLGGAKWKFWDKIRNTLYVALRVAPRGWLRQNMAVAARWNDQVMNSLDVTNGVLSSAAIDRLGREGENASLRRSPYSFLAVIAMPNMRRAIITTGRGQTWANEARVACALERCRLANGRYPENLDSLVPRFIDKLPKDVITGGALRYRTTADGGHLLYSTGWNQTDDGGKPSKDIAEGDWVLPTRGFGP